MEKVEFELQRYYKRWLYALPVLAADLLFAALMGHYLQGAMCCAVIVTVMVCSMSAYDRLTAKQRLFLTKGTLTVSGGRVKISAYGKEHEITDITELLGGTPTFFRSRCAVISADTPAGRVKLFSEPLDTEREFPDSTLSPVWKTLLESFPALTPVKKYGQETDLWYKKQ